MKAAAVTVCLLWLLLLLVFATPASSPSTFLVSSAEATGNTWTSKAPMHQARSGLGVAVVNGKIYAIGGDARSGRWPYIGSFVGTNEEYDPATDTWAFKKPMPTPRCDFAAATYQNKIYCIGGITGIDYTGMRITGVTEVYDPETDTWETKASMPTARAELCAHVVSDKIYLIGGLVSSNSPSGVNASLLNEVYDPETDTWTTKKPIPTVANVRASAVVDGKIYVIGRLSEGWDSTLNYIYDPETDTWSQGAPLPAGTANAEAGATTGVNAPKRIYVLGPNYSSLEPSSAPYITGVYDPKRDSWTFGANMPTSRLSFRVAVVNDLLYAIGGYTRTYPELYTVGDFITLYATNEQYTPFGYGTVPPKISVFSPENKTYASSIVSLAFTVNKPAVWMGYSLDNQANVTINGNTTLTGLSLGEHSLTVYANDTFGNTGTSETIYFSIAQQSEPFPTTWIAAATAITAIGAVIFLVYFIKIKKTTRKPE